MVLLLTVMEHRGALVRWNVSFLGLILLTPVKGGLPHTGILGSHGNYETDSSPLKSDLNQYGSNTETIKSQFLNVRVITY